jgi:hypothetical protein
MFLSNPRKYFLFIGFCALLFQGCGSTQTSDNKGVVLVNEAGSKFAFSTREPETFQADLVTSTGATEDHWFVARKGDKWRYDVFRGAERWISQLRSDKLYYVDHQKKVYWEMPENGKSGGDPGYLSDLTRNFFCGEEHREFDEIGRENGIIKYKVRETDQSVGEVVIYIDSASGVMVKQEFTAKKSENAEPPVSYIYEVRNLKMDVDDGVFDIPPGYKKTTPAETTRPAKPK